MRFLLIAVLSLAAWVGPASASAIQAQSLRIVTATSIWAAPLVPGTELNPSDPQVLDSAGAVLVFTSTSSGETLLPEHFDRSYADLIEGFSTDVSTAPVQEVVIPQYGLDSRAINFASDGLLYDFILAYDGQHLYLFTAFAVENSPPGMPILTRIADQLFDPARPDYSTGTMQMFLEEFAPAAEGPSERLLVGLPQRAEVPAEYQLLDEEVALS